MLPFIYKINKSGHTFLYYVENKIKLELNDIYIFQPQWRFALCHIANFKIKIKTQQLFCRVGNLVLPSLAFKKKTDLYLEM